MKHTDETDPDVPEDENTEEPNEGVVERPEEGAVFEIYLKTAGSYDNAKESERDLLTTDSDGFAASKQLPYGHYTVHQVAGEDGKGFVPDFTVFISSNGETYSYIAIIGESGSGKSTLLNVVGALDSATSGMAVGKL